MRNELESYINEFIGKYEPKKPEYLKNDFTKSFLVLTANLPRPEKFKNYPEHAIKVFGYPQHKDTGRFGCYLINDPDSPIGKTVSSETPDEKYHGVNNKVDLWSTDFGVFVVGGKGKEIRIKDIPADEKYHWYKIPEVEIGSNTAFWGHHWFIQFDLSSAFATADGIDNTNRWDLWFSAKFTGPSYVSGSQKKNAIAVDMIVLAQPELIK
jgi:hypothetical protein